MNRQWKRGKTKTQEEKKREEASVMDDVDGHLVAASLSSFHSFSDCVIVSWSFNWLTPSLGTLERARVCVIASVQSAKWNHILFPLVYLLCPLPLLLSEKWTLVFLPLRLLASNWIAVIISFIIIACNLECVTRSQLFFSPSLCTFVY